MTGTINGTYDYGACGIVPRIAMNGSKPKLVNNGYACFGGHPNIKVPGLFDALPDEGRQARQGHVMLIYPSGEQFGTYVWGTSSTTEWSVS